MLRSLRRCAISIGFSLIISIGILAALHSTPIVLARPAAYQIPPRAAAATRIYPGGAPCNTTLQACISGSAGGDSVRIAAGAYLTASLNITRAVSLIGGGTDPSAVKLQPTSGRMIQYSAVPLTASFVISNLTVENGSVGASSGGGIRVFSGAAPLFDSIVISNNQATGGGGIRIIPAVPVTLTNVTIFSNTSAGIGGGLSASGDVILIDSRVENNNSVGDGAGLDVSGTLSLWNTVVQSNTAIGKGGGAHTQDDTFSTGGLFRNNTSQASDGGAIYVGSNSAIFSATLFISNTAQLNGGAVNVTGATDLTPAVHVYFINSQMVRNSSLNGSGGGAYSNQVLETLNTQFISNTARQDGGGVNTHNAAAYLVDSEFRENTATLGYGGAATVGWLIFSNTLILSNSASGSGGVYAARDADLTGGLFQNNRAICGSCPGGALSIGDFGSSISGTRFISNTASWQGGAVYVNSTVAVTNAYFARNHSFNSGGGGLYSTGDVSLIDTQFISNTAQWTGGSLYATGSITMTNGYFENNHSSNNSGGAGYINGSMLATNSSFISNTSGGSGAGAVFASATTLFGGIFRGNSALCAGCDGGALATNALNVTGTQFISNTATDQGGAIIVYQPAAIVNATFERNTGLQGGGVYATQAAIVTSTNFISNSAGAGGGLYANSAVTVTSGLFQYNRSTYGGGLYANNYSAVKNSRFISNTTSKSGGGLYTVGPTNIVGGYFERNATGIDGGGLETSSGTINQTQFISNFASRYGGGLALFGSTSVINTLFAQNTSGNQGAGAYVGGATPQFLHDTFANVGSNPGAAIAIGSGSAAGITDTIIASHSIAISNTGGTVYEDYNLFFGNTITRSGVSILGGAHNVFGNPKFVDPVHNNFHLLAGSAAIDKAINAGVSIDFDGQARPFGAGFDIGYDEYVALKVYLPIVLKNH